MITLWLALAHAVTLDEVLAVARARAPEAASADAGVGAADARRRVGLSQLGPVVSAEASYLVHNYEVTFESEGATVVLQPLHYGMAAAGVLQPLSLPALLSQRVSALAVDAAEADARTVDGALALTVAQAYFNLLVAQESVEVVAAQVALAADQERQAATRRAAGMADERAVLAARLASARAQRDLATAQVAVDAAAAGLRRWTGRTEDSPLSWPELRPGSSPAPRPEVQAAELRARAAQRQVDVAWAQWMPELSAGLTWSWTGNAGFTGRNDLLTGVFGARWSVPVAGTPAHQRAVWLAEAKAASAERDRVEAAVEEQVALARADVARAESALASVVQEAEIAARYHQLTAEAYAAGAATALEVDAALVSVGAAKIAVVRERANVAVAQLGLRWAEGGAL